MESDAVFWWAAIFRSGEEGREAGSGKREGERARRPLQEKDTNDDTELTGSDLKASRSEN